MNRNFNLLKIFTLFLAIIINCAVAIAQKHGTYNAIVSGVPWFDDLGKLVSAHAANIVKANNRFYLFGEAHTDTSNAFAGINCYSSPDLYNWTFESIALPVQPEGRLGANRVGERPKVMKCPQTGEYVMYLHTDSLGYKDPCIGYATSPNITGPYTFRGLLLFDGKPVKKWDMGTFQDNDGAGYVLVHGGQIFKLNNDYKSISEQVLKDMSPECESPAVFRKGNTYFWLSSHRTSWERNDNFYYTAQSLRGPWIPRGIFAPEGTLTWNSQTTFVLPIAGQKDTTYLFMGDRWSYPYQASAATYVWQPITVTGNSIAIPHFKEAWQINTKTGRYSDTRIGSTIIENTDHQRIAYAGNWQHSAAAGLHSLSSSDSKDAYFSVPFNGTRIGLYGLARPQNGYAHVTLKNRKGQIIYSSLIDMYSKHITPALLYLTPVLPKDHYTLTVTATGQGSKWSDKRKSDYGSTGNFVVINKLVIED